MCRYQYASAIFTGLMIRSVRFWLRAICGCRAVDRAVDDDIGDVHAVLGIVLGQHLCQGAHQARG